MKLTAQPPMCRDRRIFSRDRLNPETERERNSVYYQFESIDKPMLNYLLIEPSAGENRSVSRVSAHASNRVVANPPISYKFKQLNRRPPHEVIRCVQVSAQ